MKRKAGVDSVGEDIEAVIVAVIVGVRAHTGAPDPTEAVGAEG